MIDSSYRLGLNRNLIESEPRIISIDTSGYKRAKGCDKCPPIGVAYRIVKVVLLLAFGLSLGFLIFFKLHFERDWQLVALMLLSLISSVYGGIYLVNFITECL